MDLNELVETKAALYRGLASLAEGGLGKTGARLEALCHPEADWRMSHPINEMRGNEAALARIWQPLKQAMPDLERRDLIFVGGSFEGRDYIAAVGHYCGTFRRDWLTIPATGKPVFLRYGEVYEMAEGKIIQANCIWDVLDLMRQAGFWPLAPSLGTEGMWPGPITGDGLVFHPTDPVQCADSLAQTLAMHKALGDYDDLASAGRNGLLAMPQRQHWHPKMMWYGPSGIGMTRGLQGFVDYHQLPFREAFPKRKGGGQWAEIEAERAKYKGGHYVRFGDGPYSMTGGWPSIFALHKGGSFLGIGATGKTVTMRVMDFYLHHEGLIRENWVPLDILDLSMQLGVDVMARMQSVFRRGQ